MYSGLYSVNLIGIYYKNEKWCSDEMSMHNKRKKNWEPCGVRYIICLVKGYQPWGFTATGKISCKFNAENTQVIHS